MASVERHSEPVEPNPDGKTQVQVCSSVGYPGEVSMSHSSASRAQMAPLVALVSVFVAVTVISLYTGVVGDVSPSPPDRDLARPGLERAVDTLSSGGVVRPETLQDDILETVRPAGSRARVTIEAGDRRWSEGPTPPETADVAGRVVAVRVEPDTVRIGRIRVVIWQ